MKKRKLKNKLKRKNAAGNVVIPRAIQSNFIKVEDVHQNSTRLLHTWRQSKREDIVMPENSKDDQDLGDVIRNPARSAAPAQRKYEPEYVRLGKEPIVKPDAEMYASVDDVSIDADGQEMAAKNGHIIDNNEFVSFGAWEASPALKNQKPAAKVVVEQTTPQETSTSPQVGDYILMVLGKLIAAGSLAEIEARVKAIIYGEDNSFTDVAVSADDVVVLKRVGIKIGVFLEE
jgi:hypothetical protein